MVFGEVSLWQAHGPRGPCTPWSAWPPGQSHNASVQTISSVYDLTDRDGHAHTGGHYAYPNQTDHAVIDEVPHGHCQNTYGDSLLRPAAVECSFCACRAYQQWVHSERSRRERAQQQWLV